MYHTRFGVFTLYSALMIAGSPALLNACGKSESAPSAAVRPQPDIRQGNEIPEIVISASRSDPARR